MSRNLNKPLSLSYPSIRFIAWIISIPILMGTVIAAQSISRILLVLYFLAFAVLILINKKFVDILLFLTFISLFSFRPFYTLFYKSQESIISTISSDGLLFANLLFWSLLIYVTMKFKFPISDIQYGLRVGIRETKYYLLLVGFAFMSLTWTISTEYSLRESLKLLYPVVPFLIALTIFNENNKVVYFSNTLKNIFIIGVLLNLGWMLYQYFNGTLFRTGGFVRINDPFISVSICAISGIFFLSYAYFNKKKQYLFFPVIVMGVVLLTATRSYIVGYIASIIYFFVFYSKKRLWKVVPLLVSFLLIYAFFEISNPLKTRMFWKPQEIGFDDFISNPLILVESEYSIWTGRFAMWSILIEKAHSAVSPLLGAGTGTSRFILSGEFGGQYYPHSDYVKHLAEHGYIGFSLFLLFLLTILFRSTKLAILASDQQSKTYLAAASGSIFYCVVAGIGYETLSSSLFYIFLLYAIGLTINRRVHRQQDSMHGNHSGFGRESATGI